jgi:hypothetical protein
VSMADGSLLHGSRTSPSSRFHVDAEALPRYSSRPFPAYAYVPGQRPHPHRDPKGHSYGDPESMPAPVAPEDWHHSADYRYAVDLYNFGYWWECHEVFEGLWKAVGSKTEGGSFFQALVDLAAGNLKHRMQNTASAIKLWNVSLARFAKLPSPYMGVDIRGLEDKIQARLRGESSAPILVRLHV